MKYRVSKIDLLPAVYCIFKVFYGVEKNFLKLVEDDILQDFQLVLDLNQTLCGRCTPCMDGLTHLAYLMQVLTRWNISISQWNITSNSLEQESAKISNTC